MKKYAIDYIPYRTGMGTESDLNRVAATNTEWRLVSASQERPGSNSSVFTVWEAEASAADFVYLGEILGEIP